MENPEWTFENFIADSRNEIVFNIIYDLATGSGPSTNPVFLCGEKGLGKSHLLSALREKVLASGRFGGPPNVVMIDTGVFYKRLVRCLRARSGMEEFKRDFRSLPQFFIFENAHELVGKSASQEELFNLFNNLHTRGVQMVFSSEKVPSEIPGLDERLKTRFEWGLLLEMSTPHFETRAAILRGFLNKESVLVSDEVLEKFVDIYGSTPGKMLEQVISLQVKASVEDSHFSSDFISKHLESLANIKNVAGNSHPGSIEAVQSACSLYFNISVADILSKKRDRKYAYPRQIAMYISRLKSGRTLQEIGRLFGGRDHTTVIHACEKLEKLRSKDSTISELIDIISKNAGF